MGPLDKRWRERPDLPAHWPELVGLLAAQNPSPPRQPQRLLMLCAMGRGSGGNRAAGGTVWRSAVYSLQSGHRAGPRAPGHGGGPPHAAIFWLASEDHDFAEINHVVFPARRELRTGLPRLYSATPRRRGRWAASCWTTRLPRWWIRPGSCWVHPMRWRRWPAYQPGRTFAQAFAEFIPGFLPRRDCWCWTRGQPRFPPHGRAGACARPWSAPTSCTRGAG
jgi:hypothetical protein